MNNAEQISPPHSISAEQAVLGGLMLDNDRWDDIATIVSADRFYSRPHGVIFSAMQTLLLQNKPIDLITLAESMEQQGTLEQCGGFAYLAELSKIRPVRRILWLMPSTLPATARSASCWSWGTIWSGRPVMPEVT